MQLFPADAVDIDQMLEELAGGECPLILRYQVDGVRVIQILRWEELQKPHSQESKSVLPTPEPSCNQGGNSVQPTCKPTSTVTENQIARTCETRVIEQGKESIEQGKGGAGGKSGLPDPIASIDDRQLREAIREWLAYRREQHKYSPKPRALAALVATCQQQAEEHGTEAVLAAIRQAEANGWKSFDAARGSPPARSQPSTPVSMRKMAPEAAAAEYLKLRGGLCG
ncbi:hypothetical protein [Aeoliella mucimassa]|nr:hypothetical protein [Aeoliella mucimassa]